MAGIKRKDGPKAGAVQPSPIQKKPKLAKEGKEAKSSKRKAEVTTESSESDPAEDDDEDFGGFAPEEATDNDDEAPAQKKTKGAVQAKDGSMKPMKSSSESHAEQRALAKERKMAKPNADSIQRSKKIWERLRRKSHVPLEERKKLVTELFELISGNVRDFIFKHDSVRVVQCALKYANKEQRKEIVKELKEDIRPLTESKYGKFLIAKMVVEGDQEVRDMIIPEYYGQIRRLINHPEGAWIVDDIYRQVASTSQKALMLREWYGAEYALFNKPKTAALKTTDDEDEATADLKTILTKNPEKRKPILQYLHQLINQLVQKKMTGFTMLHDAMLQYYLNINPGSEESSEFIELLKSDLDDESSTGGGDLLKNLAFTRSGSRVVSLALAYGGAKDRKIILRTYKDNIELMALDTNASIVLLAAMDVTDDTKMSSSTIFKELLGEGIKSEEERDERLFTLLTHPTARVPLLYPLYDSTKYLLNDATTTLINEVHAVRAEAGTSKKDPAARRNELVTYLSPHLLPFITRNADALVTSSFGTQFITETLFSCSGDKTAAVEAVAATASASPTEAEHLAQSTSGGKMLRSLIQGGRFDNETKAIVPVEPALGFAPLVYDIIKPSLIEWATGPSSFVVVALTESKEMEDQRADVLKVLKKGKKELSKAAEGEEVKDKAKGKKEKGKRGNAGARILVGKLDG